MKIMRYWVRKGERYYIQFMNQVTQRLRCERGQFALDIAIGLAIVLVISAFVVLPSLKTLSNTFFTDMSKWWSGTMSSRLFSTSGN